MRSRQSLYYGCPHILTSQTHFFFFCVTNSWKFLNLSGVLKFCVPLFLRPLTRRTRESEALFLSERLLMTNRCFLRLPMWPGGWNMSEATPPGHYANLPSPPDQIEKSYLEDVLGLPQSGDF